MLGNVKHCVICAAIFSDMSFALKFLSISLFCFGSLCRTRKGTWIDAIWVEGEHLVIEFTCGCRFMVQTVEIPNVLLCRCNMLRTIGIFGILMARNNCTWFQGLNSLKGRDPIEATVFACLSHVRMNAIVNSISSHNQTDGWDVKR